MEDFNVLMECVTSLHLEREKNLGEKVGFEFSHFLKKQMNELGRKMKPSLSTKTIQVMNIKTLFSIYQYALNNMITFLDQFVDKRVAMVF